MIRSDRGNGHFSDHVDLLKLATRKTLTGTTLAFLLLERDKEDGKVKTEVQASVYHALGLDYHEVNFERTLFFRGRTFLNADNDVVHDYFNARRDDVVHQFFREKPTWINYLVHDTEQPDKITECAHVKDTYTLGDRVARTWFLELDHDQEVIVLSSCIENKNHPVHEETTQSNLLYSNLKFFVGEDAKGLAAKYCAGKMEEMSRKFLESINLPLGVYKTPM